MGIIIDYWEKGINATGKELGKTDLFKEWRKTKEADNTINALETLTDSEKFKQNYDDGINTIGKELGKTDLFKDWNNSKDKDLTLKTINKFSDYKKYNQRYTKGLENLKKQLENKYDETLNSIGKKLSHTDFFNQWRNSGSLDIIQESLKTISNLDKLEENYENGIKFIVEELAKNDVIKNKNIIKITVNYVDWLNKVNKSPYRKVVDGITFISDSEEGINTLLKNYSDLKKNSDNTQSQQFIKQLNGKGLTITNINAEKISDVSFNLLNIVYLDSDPIRNFSELFFHECGHFLDWYNFFYINSLSINKIIDDLKDENKYHISDRINKFLDDFNQDIENQIQIFNDNDEYKKQAESNIRNQISDFDYLSQDYKNKLLENELNTLRNRYICNWCDESGYSATSDIFDAITEGKKDLPFSHGAEYFSFKNLQNLEIMADVSSLYNSGNINKLYSYLPKEIVDQFIDSYKRII